MDSIDLKNILVIKTKDETLFIKKEKISLVCYSKKDHAIYLKGVGEYLGKIDSVFIPFIDGNFEKRMNELCLTIQGVLDKKENYAKKVIDGEIDDIHFLAFLFLQDSEQEIWQDRASWVKSNPTLGIVKKWSYLDEQIDIAKTSKADRIFVLSKDFNIKQNAAESWLNIEDYDYTAVYDLEEFRGCICLGAVDLSETTDLTCAKILLMKPNDKTKYIHTMYFIPERKLTENDDAAAGAKYKEWAKNGLVTITEGNDIDLSRVADWFYSLYKDYNIKLWKCGYDQKFSKDWINRMEFYGWQKANEDLILILQNAETLSNAMKLCENDFKHRLINYNENEVDKWCLKNGLIDVDSRGRCLCVKTESAKRIDGAVTLIILYEMFRRYRTEFLQMIGG